MSTKKKSVSSKQEKHNTDDSVEIHFTDDDEETSSDSREDVDTEAEEDEQDIRLEKIETLEKEKQEIHDRLLRTMAEFDNYKKRVTREKENLITYGTEKFAGELLPVIDNIDRALEQARNTEEAAPIIEGIRMILKQFLDVLEKFHIKPFNSVGELFDPEKHEAMAQQPHDEYDENTVITECQKGYFLRDKLLRPARVIVSTTSTQQEDSPSEPDEESNNENCNVSG